MRTARWLTALTTVVGLAVAGAPATAPAAPPAPGGAGVAGLGSRPGDGAGPAAGDEPAPAHVDGADGVLPAPDPDASTRKLHSVIETNPDALREAPRPATRTAAGTGRAARWRAFRCCSRTTSTRPTGSARRPARWRWPVAAGPRRVPGTPAARGRCGHPRQGEPVRVGQLPLVRVVQRLERPRRADQQPVRARPQPVRLLQRLGGGRGRQPGRGHDRHRDRRLDRLPGRRERHRRLQADARPGQPRRGGPDLGGAGHRRPDDPHGHRRRGRPVGDPGRRPGATRPPRRPAPYVRRDYLRALRPARVAGQADRGLARRRRRAADVAPVLDATIARAARPGRDGGRRRASCPVWTRRSPTSSRRC